MKRASRLADRDFISVDGFRLCGGPAGEGPGGTAFPPSFSPAARGDTPSGKLIGLVAWLIY